MGSYLRSSRSVLSLLRCYKPASQPSLTRCYQQPLPLPRATSPPTNLARGWLNKPWKVVTAAFLAYYVTKYAVVYASGHDEIVPYTNHVHRVILSPSDERKHGDLFCEHIKKKHGDNILGPSDPNTVRVRHIANDIICGINHVLLTKTPYDDDNNIDCHDNSDGLDLVQNRSWNKQGKAKAMLPETEHLRDLNWEVFVVRDDRLIAYIKLGGKIVISTGLLNLHDTDAEIATFLAHEIGHIVARHIPEFRTYVETRVPSLSKLLDPFTRRDEIEADYIGIMLLAAAGYDPRVAPRVFQRLAEAREESAWGDYIGTHPTLKTRSRLLSQDKVMEKALELYQSQVRFRKASN